VSRKADLVERARRYAVEAHKRIDHRRKYTSQPYEVHLKAVARLVASATDDPEAIAAAWLHDVIEDTPATRWDVQVEFGEAVAALVSELTDVSRPSDGNRATRRAIDREHLERASSRAKTVKLADLIDNSRDICRHDPRFARVFLREMEQLLGVLTEGDPGLYGRAVKAWESCAAKLGLQPGTLGAVESEQRSARSLFREQRLLKLFTSAFLARDIAEPLPSFDIGSKNEEALWALGERGLPVAGLRKHGRICGYVLRSDLRGGDGDAEMRPFGRGQVLPADAPVADVIEVLSKNQHCFVEVFGEVGGLITRADIQRPVVRMWLFGIVTMVEIDFNERIRRAFPDEGWRGLVSGARLDRAESLRAERQRRGQECALLDCLQLGDKAAILWRDEATMADYGFDSKSAAKKVLGDFESLRNNLAHAQDIVTHDWVQIIRIARTVGELAAGRGADLHSR